MHTRTASSCLAGFLAVTSRASVHLPPVSAGETFAAAPPGGWYTPNSARGKGTVAALSLTAAGPPMLAVVCVEAEGVGEGTAGEVWGTAGSEEAGEGEAGAESPEHWLKTSKS